MDMNVDTAVQIPTLIPGDMLSYSAGSTQTGPSGFRRLRPPAASREGKPSRGRMLDTAVGRWPELVEILGDGTILFINAYPASVGTFDFGITVDTYLSPRVLTRALQLGRVGGHSTILLGQPLFIADALLCHVAARRSGACPQLRQSVPDPRQQQFPGGQASTLPGPWTVRKTGRAHRERAQAPAKPRSEGDLDDAEAIGKQDTDKIPEDTKTSPAPAVHAASKALRQQMR